MFRIFTKLSYLSGNAIHDILDEVYCYRRDATQMQGVR